MLLVEVLKLIAAALTVSAAVLGILGKPTNDAGALTRRGRHLITLAGLGFICTVGLQVAQYLNLLDSSRTLEKRHKEIVESVGHLRESAENIRAETNRLSTEAAKIAWGLTIDPVPIREMHAQCDFDGPIEKSQLNERSGLQIRLSLFRSHQGELDLTVTPKLTGASESTIGTLFVKQPTFRAQNVSLREIDLSPRLRKEDGEPFLLWVALPVEEVRARAQRIQGDADWPLPTVAHFRRTHLTVRVEGMLVKHVRRISLMINRDLLLNIPLHQSSGRLEGEISDGFAALQPRYTDSVDERKK